LLAAEFPQEFAQFARVTQVILFEEPKRLAPIGALDAVDRGLVRIGGVIIELNEILQKVVERRFRTYRCHHYKLLSVDIGEVQIWRLAAGSIARS
jgi:hypothetical protein